MCPFPNSRHLLSCSSILSSTEAVTYHSHRHALHRSNTYYASSFIFLSNRELSDERGLLLLYRINLVTGKPQLLHTPLDIFPPHLGHFIYAFSSQYTPTLYLICCSFLSQKTISGISGQPPIHKSRTRQSGQDFLIQSLNLSNGSVFHASTILYSLRET